MALWTPDDLSSPCDFWFDVQNGNLTKDGSDLVSQLNDESSNARHWTAVGSAQPLWVASGVNGKASIRCDSTPDVMTTASMPASSLLQVGLQGGTSRFYFEHDDSLGGGSYNECDGDATTPHFWVYVWTTTGWTFYRDGNVQGSGSHGNTLPDEGMFFHCSDLTGAGPNTFGRMYAGPGLGGSGAAYIFNRGAGDRGVSGDFTIKGLRVGAVTTAEREYVEGWGCWRTSLEGNMPGGHTHAGAAPTTGYTGTGAATLTITATGSGVHGVTGTGSATLNITATGSGAHATYVGSGSPILVITGTGAGAHGVSGTGSATLLIVGSGVGLHGNEIIAPPLYSTTLTAPALAGGSIIAPALSASTIIAPPL